MQKFTESQTQPYVLGIIVKLIDKLIFSKIEEVVHSYIAVTWACASESVMVTNTPLSILLYILILCEYIVQL